MNSKFKTQKRILSIALTILMVLSCVPLSALTAGAAMIEAVPVGSTPTPYDGKPVTPQKVTDDNYAALGFTSSNYSAYKGWFAIRDAKELYGYVNLVNGGQYSANAVLVNDIVVNSGTVTSRGSSSGTTYNWTPITGETYCGFKKSFHGTFDGNGHSVSGLYYNNPQISYIGFVGFVDSATVKNLTLKNAYFKASHALGGIIGYSMNRSYISNCRVTNDVTFDSDLDCGGIVGKGVFNISNCVSFSKVNGSRLVGSIVGEITNPSLKNNYYLKGSAIASIGGKQNGVGDNGGTTPDVAGECTALDSATASHTCVSVECKETVATCEYDGVTAHTYCLVCDKILSGSKTVIPATGHLSWTDATCLKPKVCKCGKTEGGVNASNHASNDTYVEYLDDSRHNVIHSCCKALKQTVPHNAGDPATCLNRAYCYDCGNEFGSVNNSNHENNEVYINYADDNGHNEYYTCCKALKGKVNHTADRKATCLVEAHCDACDNNFGDVDLTNHVSEETYLRVIDDKYHGIYYKCCNTLKEKVEHTSSGDSVATCTGVAHCDICGTNYGSKDSSNHTGKIISLNYYDYDNQHRLEWNCCNAYVDYEKHSYVYSLNKDTNEIIGNCPDCGASYSVGISVPENPVYTGFGIYASTKGKIMGIYPKITYSTENGNAPVNVGTYTATITLGNATISDTFTITPKTLTLTNVVSEERYYDGTNNVPIKGVDVDGKVILEGRNYSNNFTLVYDDVYVDFSNAKATVSDVIPDYYDVVEISGCTLAGKSAGNYTLTIADEVTLERFYINHYYVNISIENQNLLEGEALDNSKYTLIDPLLEGYELTDVVLAMDEWSRHIYLESYAIKKDGVDYSDCFDVSYSNGIYAIKCLNHDTSNNGICPNCDTYEPAKINLNESGEFVYEISNAGQLLWFGEQVNFYNTSGHAKLMEDIDLNPGYTFNFDGSYLLNGESTDVAPLSFIPIGNNNGMPYNYNFDGNGKTLSGIYINTPESEFVGLFGKTDYMCTISDLHISNSYICGDNHIGAIAGYASTYFDKCSVDKTVIVTGKTEIGGMVGYLWYGEIKNSWSRANVTSNYAGGIVGILADATVKNSYTTHYNIAGGSNSGVIVNSYYFNEPANYDGGKTLEQFASGEVAYLLQTGVEPEEIYDEESDKYITAEPEEIWGQKIGIDEAPVLGGDKVYYGYKDCNATEITYCNNTAYDKVPTHTYENGSCTICGGKDPDAKGVSIFGDISLTLEETDENIFTGVIELQAGTYSFNLDDGATTLGFNVTFTDTKTIDYSGGFKVPSKLNATGGRYTFTYNATSKKLTIKHKPFTEIVELFGDINVELVRTSSASTVFTGSARVEAGTYQFKVNDQGVAKGFGYTFDDAVHNAEFNSKWTNSATFNATGGIYSVSYDTATSKLTFKHSPKGLGDVRIFGDINLDLAKEKGTIYSSTQTLAAGTYEFRIDSFGTTLCNGSKFTNYIGQVEYMNTWKSATKFVAKGGKYTFKFDSATNKLTVVYAPLEEKVSIFGDIELELKSTDNIKYTGKINLEAGTYSFRVDDFGITYCCGITIKESKANVQYSTKYKAATILEANGGTYSFTYNKSNNQLTIYKTA